MAYQPAKPKTHQEPHGEPQPSTYEPAYQQTYSWPYGSTDLSAHEPALEPPNQEAADSTPYRSPDKRAHIGAFWSTD